MTNDPHDDLYVSTEMESAVVQGDRDTFDKLLDETELTHRSANGSTLLHKATIVGQTEIASELIDAGIHIDAQDNEKKTALHFAIDLEHWDLVELLIKNGADPNTHDINGNSPLMPAIRNATENKTYIRLLLENGADPSLPNDTGETPLDKMRSVGYTKMVELLEKYAEE